MPAARVIDELERKFNSPIGELDERGRRRWPATEAMAFGSRGITAVSLATGLSERALSNGIKGLRGRRLAPGHILAPGLHETPAAVVRATASQSALDSWYPYLEPSRDANKPEETCGRGVANPRQCGVQPARCGCSARFQTIVTFPAVTPRTEALEIQTPILQFGRTARHVGRRTFPIWHGAKSPHGLALPPAPLRPQVAIAGQARAAHAIGPVCRCGLPRHARRTALRTPELGVHWETRLEAAHRAVQTLFAGTARGLHRSRVPGKASHFRRFPGFLGAVLEWRHGVSHRAFGGEFPLVT